MLALLVLVTLAQVPVPIPPREPDPVAVPEQATEPSPGTGDAQETIPPLPVASLPPATHELFERIKRRVAQVRIIERRSGTKSSIGSAFFVSAQGHAITNYHVVSDLVFHPEDYTAELVRDGQQAVPVRLIDVDVVHDLAVVRFDQRMTDFFALEERPPPQGARLFAMGNPRDLGTTIVEGTYNGLVQEAFYDRVHFSGAINPGMSGGPTLTGEGRVVGVNVATMGNQVGFLVPVEHARALLTRARQIPEEGPSQETLFNSVRTQIFEHQQRVTDHLLATPLPPQTLGAYQVPGRWLPFLKCWGDTPHDAERPYSVTNYQCSSEEDLFLNSEHRTGVVSYVHQYVASTKLSTLRFATLYGEIFSSDPMLVEATRDDVTNFRCRSEFVDSGGLTLRAALCMRAYKKFPGIYDLVLRAAALPSGTQGVDTSLTLAGFSPENAQRLARRYLEGMSWKR
ncbi:S1 family peptidase [Stigmatella aurantiaca]|uniref:Peptidase, S1C (Protease Do) subfamily n=1 Tax=Stigmatella aurantiaca (strain DW4/3-1) TaxID=378806 RepID=Q08Q29_STIAD|nr:serine protease [Stigmatella aurantiaca]ADO72255.1 Peptidase, S1C (Protease Do) subfamily [Stigmatella aurantiaca DW4/3-1]EAU62583.1 serine protease [Stigmatella aurantiaca DW4/3-1]